MNLQYKNKRSKNEILLNTKPAYLETKEVNGDDPYNILFEGENLQVMKTMLNDLDYAGKIDLVYIDPPFSTNNTFKYNSERTATISSRNSDEIAYNDTLKGFEFIEFLRERLIFVYELMAKDSSIYLHIDYKIGHYVKVILDEIFGPENFRNDITRIKCNPKNFPRKGYSNIKDMILFYTKGKNFVWNEPKQDMTDEDIKKLYPKIDCRGRRYTTTPLHAPGETDNGNTGKKWNGILPSKGRHWRYDPKILDQLDKAGLIEWSSTGNPRKIIYAEESRQKGKRVQDIWEFKDSPYPEYPTEKNSDLLNLIIRTSSLPCQLVFDCFCGSGTTLMMANKLQRKWIGIDNSKIAIDIIKNRLTSETPLINTGAEYVYIKQVQKSNKRKEKSVKLGSSNLL